MKHAILSGCAIIREDKLLLLWKIKRGFYELPGGKVDAGETLEETAIREIKEEAGLDVVIVKNAGCITFTLEDKEVQSNIFIAQILNGTPTIMEPEVFDHLIWMPIQEYEKYLLAPNVIAFCRSYANGNH